MGAAEDEVLKKGWGVALLRGRGGILPEEPHMGQGLPVKWGDATG